jgi:thiamine transport system ATP-binding protein
LARVLVRNRPVLLLDEPFGSLGPALREDMLDLLVDVQAERRMTVLFVTHQPDEARRVAENMVFLEDGTVAAAGPTAHFFAKDGPEAFRRYIGTAF